jgi:hypothetical protein
VGRARLGGLPLSLSLAAVAALGSCRDPTEITLQLTTDFDCAQLGANPGTTSISVAPSLASITLPTTTIPSCDAQHADDLGSLVLVPSGDGDDVAVEIVAGVGREACTPDAPDVTACIVAKRRIRFVKHERLVLPIVLRGVCAGVTCTGDLTCIDGQCASSLVDTGSCPGGVCAAETDASATRPDAIAPEPLVVDAGRDAATDGTSDAKLDARLDGPVCAQVGPAPSTPKEIDCPLGKVSAICTIPRNRCCGSSCAPATNLCSAQPTSDCDESADCGSGMVCCLAAGAFGPTAACAPTCPPTTHQLCKSSCDCGGCAVAPCAVATCDGKCP